MHYFVRAGQRSFGYKMRSTRISRRPVAIIRCSFRSLSSYPPFFLADRSLVRSAATTWILCNFFDSSETEIGGSKLVSLLDRFAFVYPEDDFRSGHPSGRSTVPLPSDPSGLISDEKLQVKQRISKTQGRDSLHLLGRRLSALSSSPARWFFCMASVS